MKTWDCVAIVGVGLIGGSVGLAVRSRQLAKKVVGTGSRPATLETAQQLGAIDKIASDAKTAMSEADLVVVCAPVGNVAEQILQLAPLCCPGTLLTDAGSTKLEIVRQLERAAAAAAWGKRVHFIGSHPLAGNEKRGPQFAMSDLFVGRTVVITPTESSPADACRALSEFWTSLGSRVVQMSAEEHDRALAATSHLPHLVAAAIASATPEEYVTLTASGWQDTTRIAAGDPALWRQIMLTNRANLLAALEQFSKSLGDWQRALSTGDAAQLERLLNEAKRIRDAVGN